MLILIVGMAVAAYLLNVPALWIFVGVIALLGVGAVVATRRPSKGKVERG